MDSQYANQVRELLERYQTVAIAIGKNPTVDEAGAALAFYLALSSSGKTVSILSAEEPTVELSHLVGIDKVKSSFKGEDGDLVVSFPYREGEIDKISYTLDGGFLNIVVKPSEQGLSFSQQDVIFRRAGGYPQLLFTVSVSRLSDLSQIFDVAGLKDTAIVNIDNKPDNQGFGDVLVQSLGASSVSEQVAGLIQALGLEIDVDVAQNLLSGISDGTSNFQNPKTSPLAFEMAAVLMQKGAVRERPVSRVEQVREEEFSDVQSKVLQSLQSRPFAGQRPNIRRQDRRQDNRGQDRRQDNKGQQQGDVKNPPEDWLAPKVYKGSTNI